MPTRLTIGEVNGMDREAFVRRFGSLYERSPWVAEGAWLARPFGGFGALREAFEGAVLGASEGSKLALVRAHPDLAGKAAVAGDLTEESAREQASAGLDRLTPEEYGRFTRTNAAYREKFGIPFVVCVREHTKASILANADARLGNTPQEELETALGEIRKISGLRLRDMVEDTGGSG